MKSALYFKRVQVYVYGAHMARSWAMSRILTVVEKCTLCQHLQVVGEKLPA